MICAVPPTPLSALPAVPIVMRGLAGFAQSYLVTLRYTPTVWTTKIPTSRWRLAWRPCESLKGSVPDPRRGTERGVHRCDGVRAQPPRVELTPSYPAEACLIRPPWWSASEASFSRWIGPPPSRPLADGPHGQAWRSGPVGP